MWDEFFAFDGKRKTPNPPVTSNKVRGPLSQQTKKIGSHAYYLIDHIFFDPQSFQMRGHAFHPKIFPSAAAALEEVQPSLLNPSDHYPVIVDLSWREKDSIRCRTC